MKVRDSGVEAISAMTAGYDAMYRLLKLDDLCMHMNLSIAQVHKLRRAGKILRPTATFGRSPRWLDIEFYDWMRAGCPPAMHWKWKGGKRDGG